MTAERVTALLARLRGLGVRLWVEGEKLRYQAPPGVLTPDLTAALRREKGAVLAFLQEAAAATAAAPVLEPAARDGRPLPASAMQESLWFLQQVQPENAAYNIPEAFHLTGALDVAALRAALQTLAARHEALRTGLQMEAGELVQAVAPAVTIALPVLQAADVAAAQTRIGGMAARPFGLAEPPLLRAALFALDDGSHVFYWNVHHSVADGWSMGVLRRELGVVYAGLVGERPSSLPDLPIQYADFAVWQRDWLASEAGRAALAYWEAQLAGETPILQLPSFKARPPLQSFRGGRLPFDIPEDVAAGAKAMAGAADVTLFMLLLAVFKVVLFRYTGERDLPVGTPAANRGQPGTADVVGFFVNTLALRSQASGEMSFRQLLAAVRETVTAALARQEVPLEAVVTAVQPERDLSAQPLFQVMFSLQEAGLAADLALAGMTVRPLSVYNGTAKFDLNLTLRETAGGLAGMVTYSRDLFDADGMQRLVGHFRTVLAGVVADGERPLARLPLLTEAEVRRQLVVWNRTAVDYGADVCLHQLFEAQAARTPDAPAAAFEGETLSYRELNERANRVAHYLRGLGVGPDSLVGLYLNRSLDLLVGLLGILKAGGAYVPLDPAYPASRLAFMLADAGVPALLTEAALAATLPETAAEIICLDRDWATLAQEPATNGVSGVEAEHLAYVIYTSGSTGRPKGVGIPHRAIVNYTRGIIDRLALPSGWHFGLVSTAAADLGNTVLFPALATGGCLHILSLERVTEADAFRDYLDRYPLDCVKIVPSHLAALQETSDGRTALPRRMLVLGGEASRPSWVGALQAAAPDCVIFNHYGPTETTVGVLTHRLTGSGGAVARFPLGRPLPNSRVYILDEAGEPVPVGAAGELYIGGAGLARGYLGRPDLTAERFVTRRLPGVGEERLYRTGDVARYLPGGEVEFLGRMDDQVKIRGFRVELGEIRAALVGHTAVREAFVTVHEFGAGDRRLAAYVVGETAVTAGALRAFLRERLPAYMMPAAFVLLPSLPLTPNGKVDTGVLPPPDVEGMREGERAVVEPRTPLERRLAALWADVLGQASVGVETSFFELGGHSLLAAQLAARVRAALPVALSLADLLAAPTVAAMAQRVEQALASGEAAAQAPDLAAEARLAADIAPVVEDGRSLDGREPEAILLTGATGFLGAYLLAELLAQTGWTVHCLVRAADEAAAWARLRKTMTFYRLAWDEARVRVVVGDLARPWFGLEEPAFARLADTVDVVLHNGAWVNFVYPYSVLKDANVTGTETILRLACRGRARPVHFVSTLSVFSPDCYAEEAVIPESDPVDCYAGLTGGYPQSKWAAEKLVTAAGERGLPVTVYRPGRVGGASDTGIGNEADFLFRLIQGCVAMGAAPDASMVVNVAPVDYVTRALVFLLRQPDAAGEAFHLLNPQPAAWRDVVTWLQEMGYPLALLSVSEWLEQAAGVAELRPFLALLRDVLQREALRISSRRTLARLQGSGIACPSFDAGLLAAYLSYFHKKGFLSAPVSDSIEGGSRGRSSK